MRLTSPTGKCMRMGFAGFTLLEMLVAITIGSIIMAAAYGTFAAVTRTARRVDDHNAMIQNLRFACGALRRDLGSAVPAPAGNAARNKWAGNSCRFTVWCDEDMQALVRYEYRNRSLVRRAKPLGKNLGNRGRQGRGALRREMVVARNVSGVRFQYYAEKSWQDRLRPKQWPRAIRLILKLGPDPKTAFTFAQVMNVECE